MKRESPMLALALAGALVIGIACAWSPRYWSVAVALMSVCAVAAAWAIVTRDIDRNPRLGSLWIAIGFISAWGFLQIGTRSSVAPWLTSRAALCWAACGISFFLASQSAGRGRSRRLFLSCLLWCTTALAVGSLLQRVQGIFAIDPTLVGTFLYKNHFAALIEMVAPIALCRLAVPERRFAGGIAFAVLFAAMVASASRSGVILLLAELVIAVAVMLRQHPRHRKTTLSLAAASVAVLCAASWIVGPARLQEHFREKSPWSLRRQLAASTVRMASQRPWLGSGMGTWRTVYPAFATFDAGLIANEAHSDWAEWASEGGVPFALLMAFLTVRLVRPAVQSIWGLGVPIVMVHSLVDYPIREPATALLWFALAGALACSGAKVTNLALGPGEGPPPGRNASGS